MCLDSKGIKLTASESVRVSKMLLYMDIEEQSTSDGCRGWEVGREGNWVKDSDVAACFTLLFLPGWVYR